MLLLLLLVAAIQQGNSLALTGVTLKIAVDANGGVADQAASVSDRFTCAESLDAVHRLRRDSDAVLIGRQTVVADNPSLLVRRGVVVEKQPLRVILDTNLSLLRERLVEGTSSSPSQSSLDYYRIFNDTMPTLVYHGPGVSGLPLQQGTNVVTVSIDVDENGRLSIPDVWRDLREHRDVLHLMVEGGPKVAQSFLKCQMVDRCVLIRATTVKFRKPISSGIDSTELNHAGLKLLGRYGSGVDEVECWSRDIWPTKELGNWP